MTNAASAKTGYVSWKGTFAILLVAVMVMMVGSPLVSADPAPSNTWMPENPAEMKYISSEEVAGGTIYWQTLSLQTPMSSVPCDNPAVQARPGSYKFVPSNPSPMAPGASILAYTDDWVHTSPNTFVQQALSISGLPATVYIDGNYGGFETALTTGGPWDLVIWSGENYAVPGTTTAQLRTYLQGGGKLIATYWTQLSIPADPLWAEMGFTYIANYQSPVFPCYWWNDAHPIFTTPEDAPEWINRVVNSGTSQGTYIEPTANGDAVAGYTLTPSANNAGIVIRDDKKAIYKAIRDVSTNVDSDMDTKMDGAELWVNMIDFILTASDESTPLNIYWYDDYEEEQYSGSIREYLESQGHTVTYQEDSVGVWPDAAAMIGVYDVIVAEHTCGGQTIINLDQWFAAGKGYVALFGGEMYNDPPEDDYIMNLMGVDWNGGYNDGSWGPTDLAWTDPAHPIATFPNSGWELTNIPAGQYQYLVNLNGGDTVAECPAGPVLQTMSNVEGSGRIAALGSNYHGVQRTDPEARKLVENMIYWSSGIRNAGYPTNVAIFQTTDPWGYDAIQEIYDTHSIPYTIFGPADIGVIDLTPYDKAIIVGGDGQDESLYDAVADNLVWFEEFAAAGGAVNVHVDDWGDFNDLPFGLSSVYDTSGSQTVDIAIPGHPLLMTPNVISDAELDGWNSAYHRYFTDWPGDAEVVLTEGDKGGNWPVCLDIPWGDGRVIATGQTVEWAWGHAYSPFLENILLAGSGKILPVYTFKISPADQIGIGWVGDYVDHPITIKNTGNVPNTYRLFSERGMFEWPTEIWNEGNTEEISHSELLEPGDEFTFNARVRIPRVEHGEFDVGTIGAESVGNPAIQHFVNVMTVTSLDVPFYDDFESGVFGEGPYTTEDWTTDNPDFCGINDWTAYSPDHSMFTNGEPVTVTSAPIYLEGIDRAIVSFIVQRGASWISEYPDEPEESLVAEYFNTYNRWVELQTFPGGGPEGEVFTCLYELPEDAFHPAFRLRFRQNAGSGENYDYWHIDDVYIGGGQAAFDVTPEDQSKYSGPGAWVTYDLHIENFAPHTDWFMISVSGNTWPTYAPEWIGPVAPFGGADFTVDVYVPEDADPDFVDTAQIAVTSSVNPWMTDYAFLQTNVVTVHNLDLDIWYPTIQEAVDGAMPGNTIWAYPHLYEESVTVDKPLTIQGVDRDATIVSSAGAGGTTTDWLGYNDGYTENSIGAGGSAITMAIELTDTELAGFRNSVISELYVSGGSDDYGFFAVPYDIWIENSLPAWGDVYTGGVNIVRSGTTSGTGWETIDIPDYPIPDTGSVVIGFNFAGSSVWPCGLDQSNTGPTPRANYCTIEGYGSWSDIGSFGFPGVWGLDVGISSGGAVFNILSDYVTIDGFTIQDGSTGILLSDAYYSTITSNRILCENGIAAIDSGYSMIAGNEILGDGIPSSMVIIDEDFEDTFPPTDWTVVNYGGTDVWQRNDVWSRPNYAGGMGYCADADSDAIGSGTTMDTGLRTPEFDLTEGLSAQLEFDHSYNDIGGADYAQVRVSTDGGTSWTQIAFYNEDHSALGPGEHITLSLNAFLGEASVIIEFRYGAATWDWWWEVDNVNVHANFAPDIGIEINGWQYSNDFSDDFSEDSGFWNYRGYAYRDTAGGGRVLLTGDVTGQYGQANFDDYISTDFQADFRYWAGSGSGADGMCFMFYKDLAYLPGAGGSLGFDGSNGYAIEFDNYFNGGVDPNERHIGIIQNSYTNHLAVTGWDNRVEDSTWHNVRVTVIGNTITVYVDDMITPLLQWTGAIDRSYGGMGFSAGTGGLTNYHYVDDVRIQWGGAAINLIALNSISYFDIGADLVNTGGETLLFWNDFLGNAVQAQDDSANYWDWGYPVGGNYWSDYSGTDSFRGPLQNIAGSDGFGDTPYVFIGGQDNYPMMESNLVLGVHSSIETWEDFTNLNVVYEEPETEPAETEGSAEIPADMAAAPVEPISEEAAPEQPADDGIIAADETPEEPAAVIAQPAAEAEPQDAAIPEPNTEQPAATETGGSPMIAVLAIAASALILCGIAVRRRKR